LKLNMKKSSFYSFFSLFSVIAIVLICLFVVVVVTVKGINIINLRVIFGDTNPFDAIFKGYPVFGGILYAIAGTLMLIFLSSALCLPVGIMTGIYLSMYATKNEKSFFNMFIDVLSGIPSILLGLLGYSTIIFIRNILHLNVTTSIIVSSVCLAILALPYVIRAVETSIDALPLSVRMLGNSLGISEINQILHIIIPTASKGILGGIILAIGRISQDTAVILLTGVTANAGLPRSLWDKFEAIPFKIYYLSGQYKNEYELNLVFASCFILLLLTSALFYLAYFIQGRIAR